MNKFNNHLPNKLSSISASSPGAARTPTTFVAQDYFACGNCSTVSNQLGAVILAGNIDSELICCEEGFHIPEGSRAGACTGSTTSEHDQKSEEGQMSSQQSNSEYFYAQTHRFYEACALCYEELYPDHVQASKNAAQAVASLFHRYSITRILDASCGLGHDIENFSKQGFKVDGADISPKMLRLAEERLRALGLDGVRLYQCDVRALKEVIPAESYDAVIFRGNTLSNLEYSDYPIAFSQMAYVLRPNGLLYVDFRDGEAHFRAKKRLEFRGFHFSKATRTLSIAWYVYRHGLTLDDTFQVTARVISLGWSSGLLPRLRRFSLQINSHYVPEPKVSGGLEQAGFKILDKIDVKGLPYLQTYIAQKVAPEHP